MARRTALVAAGFFVAFLALPLGSASALITGTGTTVCGGAWTGAKITFSPALKTAGTSTFEEISVQATIKPCVGGVPTPTKGALVGKGVFMGTGANKCANVFPLAPPGGSHTFAFSGNLTEAIRWTPTSIANTQVTFPTLKVTTTTAAAKVIFSSVGGTATGSYATAAASQTLKTQKTYTTILGAGAGDCSSATGVTSLVIQAGGTTGTY